MPKWLKITLKITGGIISFIIVLLLATALYITYNKDKVLKQVNASLNKNLDGTVIIGDMEPGFFRGFPYISLSLKNVSIRDRRFQQHHHTLLDAKNFDISVNIFAFLKGTLNINHIDISNAAIDLYTDSTGYSNTSVFNKGSKQKKDTSFKRSSFAELEKFTLENVGFSEENQKANKLFNFMVNNLSGKISYPDSGWHAAFHLNMMAKSLAFNTRRGSYIKNKLLDGDFEAGYNADRGTINIATGALKIGTDLFKINAIFQIAKKPSAFYIHVAADNILWRHVSALLAQNIEAKLNQYNITKPLAATATIAGDFASRGDPFLYITANVKNNTVSIPGSVIDSCSFDGVFTNNFIKSNGLSDENSVIRLKNMTGLYNHLPFTIDTGSIANLNKPIVTGHVKSGFVVSDLNYMLGNNIAKFGNGTANINLNFKADIINYQINKPIISGTIDIKNSDFNYLPDNLAFKNSSLFFSFIGNDLVLSNIRLQSGRSIVTMEGRVNNFLNLYYDAPEKILLTWQIRSSQLYLGEFLGFLSSNSKPVETRKTNTGNIFDQLSTVLQKGNAEMHIDVTNAHYNKFLASDANADLLTSSDSLIIKSLDVKTAEGALHLKGYLKKGNALNKLSLNTNISNVNIRDFFYSFDNFGMQDFTYQNLQGILSANGQITADIDNKGLLIPHSVNGNLDINLRNGALIDFSPITSIGKFAFPFRNLRNITIPKLDGKFILHGDKIEISPMQINSSVLNIDVAGTYGLTNGTNISLDIPLRNPKKDKDIEDKEELQKNRYKGIVLHILAKSDETGKIKFSWNKNHKDTKN